MAQLEHIEAIEKRLWGAADTLKAEKLRIDQCGGTRSRRAMP